MQRCIDLAELGMGKVSPNPMVGCVIVHNAQIIGEGWHQSYGAPHAEVNAVEAVKSKFGAIADQILQESTVYVSLEPCAHFGKTPPCADLLVKHKVRKVVIGSGDPNPSVNGKGVNKLRAAGIEVEMNVLKAQCDALNKRFFCRIQKQRPYVILKWAETKDGYFAPKGGAKRWITGPEAIALTHKWRSEEDAILVGKNTALIDNPELTVRNWTGRHPKRILIDRNLSVPPSHLLYNKVAPTIVLNTLKTEILDSISFIALEDMDFYLPQKILYQLHLLDIQSVIIEGGANILKQFITAGLWDEARVWQGPENWGDGLEAPNLTENIHTSAKIGADTLKTILNQ